MKSNPFSFIRSKVEDHMPEALRPLNNEIKKTTRKIVNEKLAEFDLVPRQEFEQQQRLLAQAEQRIASLEKQLEELQQGKMQQANRQQGAAHDHNFGTDVDNQPDAG